MAILASDLLAKTGFISNVHKDELFRWALMMSDWSRTHTFKGQLSKMGEGKWSWKNSPIFMWHEWKTKDCYLCIKRISLLMLQEKESPGKFYVFITGSKVNFIQKADTLIKLWNIPSPFLPKLRSTDSFIIKEILCLFSDTSCRFHKEFITNFLQKYFSNSLHTP